MSKRDKENTNNESRESVNLPSEGESEIPVDNGELSEIEILREEVTGLQATLDTTKSELSELSLIHI